MTFVETPTFRKNAYIAVASLLTVLVLALATGRVTWPLGPAEAAKVTKYGVAAMMVVQINLYIMERDGR